MDSKYFQSDNPAVLAKVVQQAVYSDRNASYKTKMKEGVDYYEYKHDILNYRFFYADNEGKIHEETSRSNIKISHAYFTELTDQEVQYLLSNPVEFLTETDGLKEYLPEYLDEDFQLTLQEVLEGSIQKGYDFVYVKKTDQKVVFNHADSLKIIEIYDADFNLTAIIRYYDTDIFQDGRMVRVTRAELWNDEKTWYFINGGTLNQTFKLDETVEANPMYHETLINQDNGEVIGKGFGYIPFFRLDNNKAKTSGLAPVKNLIDDYDLMACALSNNLQDFDQPFFAVKNFSGDNYETMINNLRSRGAVGVGSDGGIDVHTVDIPVEARKAKLEVDKEGIYKFGMGFDSSQTGDGNITNVVIQSRYSLLDLKCNKAEVRLRRLIKQMLEVIIQDINERHGKAFKASDIEIKITRATMVNETEVKEREKVEEETKQLQIANILTAANRFDDETVLKKLCEVLDLEFAEIKGILETQDYGQNIDADSDPIE